MTKDPRVYLAHILERALRIEAYLRDGQDCCPSSTTDQGRAVLLAEE